MRCATQKVFNTLLASNILYLASTSGDHRQIYLGYAAQIINKEVEKETMKYRHIVFDLDGTLLDTEEAVLNAWQHTLKAYRYHFPLEELRVVLGITVEKGIDALGVLLCCIIPQQCPFLQMLLAAAPYRWELRAARRRR